MHKHVVIAGAGPAGLACARAIVSANSGTDILLLEAGRPYDHRPCPVDRGFKCTGCAGLCNVVSGFGGSMHYGDGAKLSLLPSGRRLVPHLGADRATELCDTAFSWLTEPLATKPPLMGENLTDRAIHAFATNHLRIREYPVAVLGESDLRTVIGGWHDLLAPAVELWHSAELAAARPNGDGLALTVRTARGEQQVTCDHLVLATGRRGVTSTTALLQNLAVPTDLPDISIGVRLEMAAELLEAIGEEHPDLKVSQLDHAQKIKSFCFCGGPNGGRIKLTNYQDAFGESIITLDGHETTERERGNRSLASNFGLLCQVQGRGNALQARDSFIATYRRLASGRPFAQSLRGFLQRTGDRATWLGLESRMPFQPSVMDLSVGRVDQLFTDAEHASLVAGLRRFMDSILAHSGRELAVDDLVDDVLVVGPEMEFLWEKPRIDADCKVPDLPVYVVGDCAGIAQGVVQAAMMGIAAGRAIAATGRGQRTTLADTARR
ncbi:putative FAD-dependent dehydrogenase [Kitasatospora sp. MAP12-15]|uniref:DNA polymerase subunit beta n=1 Tax=unclassified Kitasatospora TaxID=2633591 RepID=UPI002473A8BB|nr:DNA polymerase subunit beta [Kitasatospora sp. MAP12-44]MDH6115674.1 putative FAD-dependent dehydrogenase [Kitasatospora sp. MAP12-44]